MNATKNYANLTAMSNFDFDIIVSKGMEFKLVRNEASFQSMNTVTFGSLSHRSNKVKEDKKKFTPLFLLQVFTVIFSWWSSEVFILNAPKSKIQSGLLKNYFQQCYHNNYYIN